MKKSELAVEIAKIISPEWFNECSTVLNNYPEQHMVYREHALVKAYDILDFLERNSYLDYISSD